MQQVGFAVRVHRLATRIRAKVVLCCKHKTTFVQRQQTLYFITLCHCSFAEGLLQNGWITMGLGYSLSEERSVCILSCIPKTEEDHSWW